MVWALLWRTRLSQPALEVKTPLVDESLVRTRPMRRLSPRATCGLVFQTTMPSSGREINRSEPDRSHKQREGTESWARPASESVTLGLAAPESVRHKCCESPHPSGWVRVPRRPLASGSTPRKNTAAGLARMCSALGSGAPRPRSLPSAAFFWQEPWVAALARRPATDTSRETRRGRVVVARTKNQGRSTKNDAA